MTIYRPAASTEAIVLEAVRLLSEADIKAATGKTLDFFRKVSQGKSVLSLEDAARLDGALEARGFPRLFEAHFRDLVGNTAARLRGEKAEPGSVDATLRRVVADVGELSAAVDQALADEVMEPHEARRIATVARRGIVTLKRLLRIVEPPVDLPRNVVRFTDGTGRTGARATAAE